MSRYVTPDRLDGNLLQVATGAGTISHFFNLHVVVPSAFILGSGEYHIGEGSTISLVCIIENVSTRNMKCGVVSAGYR
jgi:hypothetical protein